MIIITSSESVITNHNHNYNYFYAQHWFVPTFVGNFMHSVIYCDHVRVYEQAAGVQVDH